MRASSEASKRSVVRRREWAAVVLGLTALALAILAAQGPARARTQEYAWPPARLPAASPTKAWYAPLYLSARKPVAVDVELPCSLAPALPESETYDGGKIVLATSRRPDTSTRLAVLRYPGALVVTIKDRTVVRMPWPPRPPAVGTCTRSLHVVPGKTWVLRGSNGDKLGSGHALPFVVTSLSSGLDLRRGAPPRVVVEASVLGTSPTSRQVVLSVLAAILAGGALALAIAGDRARRPQGVRASHRIRPFGAVDAVVVTLLTVWWIISPSIYDDGWVYVRERIFEVSGTLSPYYDNPGASMPAGYWYEWLHHWLVLATSAVPVLRLPALLLGVASWLVCRWILVQLLPAELADRRSVRWTLAAAFLVASLSWGMTLRPEPIVALLAGLVLGAMVRFRLQPGLAPLVLAGLCIVLAFTAHPEGVVALAPVLAASPSILAWLRANGRQLVPGLVAAGGALAAVLLLVAFADSDIASRSDDARIIRDNYHGLGWKHELVRYGSLGGASGLQRASVALLTVALLSFVFRRRRLGLADFAGWALLLAFLTLFLTPSKWPWHLGALIVMGSVAVAVEAAHLSDEGTASREKWALRPFAAMVLVAATFTWAWSFNQHWNVLDLRTIDASRSLGRVIPGFHADLSLLRVWIVILLEILAAGALVQLLRGRRKQLSIVPWRVAAWIVPIASLPLLVATMGTFVRDAQATDGWTFARQNLESLRGTDECGLADDIVVPDTASFEPLTPVGPSTLDPRRPRASSALRSPAVPGLVVWGPFLDGSPAERSLSRWYEAPTDSDIGLFVVGNVARDRIVRVEWGRHDGNAVRTLGAARVKPDRPFAGHLEPYAWRFLAAGALPARPAEANAVRVGVVNNTREPRWALGASAPVRYRSRLLAPWLEEHATTAIVHPVFGLYLPCATPPPLADGVVGSPDVAVLNRREGTWPLREYSGPFSAVTDVEPVTELSTADSPLPLTGLTVYTVDHTPPAGEALAPAVAQR